MNIEEQIIDPNWKSTGGELTICCKAPIALVDDLGVLCEKCGSENPKTIFVNEPEYTIRRKAFILKQTKK